MPKTNFLKEALAASPEPAPRPSPEPIDRRLAPTKLVGAHFPEPVHRQLRVLAAQQGRTQQDLIAEALNDLFAKHKFPPIA